ncbi:MAG: dienelactone hydrolase family protein [Acidobacteria bacterium]|nr:dienelactone hydrolase family protein [Acidobacteriota bacterium]
MSEPMRHDRVSTESGTGEGALDLVKRGIAVLNMDPRGHVMNRNPKHFRFFSPKDMEKIQLDVRAAVQFLASQKNVDPGRIGVVAIGMVGTYAVLAAENPAIRALGLISGLSGSLSQEALDFISGRSDLPILAVARTNDKAGLWKVAQAYALSKNPNSALVLAEGYGSNVFSVRETRDKIVHWVAGTLKELGTSTEVSFRSSDGWSLHGVLRLPEGASEGSKVPGVVFSHGMKHDLTTYYNLANEVVKHGMAALLFDWRGKGPIIKENASRGMAGIDLPREEQETKAHLDVKAAIEFLAAQKAVDSNRIALVGATSGAGYAAEAAIGEARVKAIVFFTVYPQGDKFKQYLRTHDVSIFAVDTEDFSAHAAPESARELVAISKGKHNKLIVYTDVDKGSEMLEGKPDLEPAVVDWLVERLGLATQKNPREVASH